jgi:BlaI family penicillinase repressor
MMARKGMNQLSRRERQIMDIIYSRGQVTVSDVLAGMPDPPSYSAVRAMLRILEEKGYVRHEQDGPRYVFKPVVSREEARKSAVKHLMRTFFDGSTEKAMAAILDASDISLTEETYRRLRKLIDQARSEEEQSWVSAG